VLVLGSLRPGEERYWFPGLAAFRGGAPLNVVVAPRHQERFEYFAERLSAHGLAFRRRSGAAGSEFSSDPRQLAPDVVLLDTLGELERVYSFADAAFIGGSLVPGFGGHNPLEAAAYGVCVAMGPHCENVDDLIESLRERGGYIPLRTAEDAGALIARLSAGDAGLAAVGRQGREVWRLNSGAADRIMAAVDEVIAGRGFPGGRPG